jgi:hypothetical protein
MDNNALTSLLITSAVPFVLTVICLVTAGLAFLRQTELGEAAAVAGWGFGALAVASALKIAMFYIQISAFANHTATKEILRSAGWFGLGTNVAEIAGVVLIAIAMFQRRPVAQAPGVL